MGRIRRKCVAGAVLGLHGGVTINQHDAGACLVSEGVILAAAEEERFSRVKGSFGKLPIKSISACLSQAKMNISDIDLVVIPGITYPDIIPRTKKWIKHHFGFSPEVLSVNHQHAHLYSTLPMGPSLGDCLISSDAYGDQLTGAVGTFNSQGTIDIKDEILAVHSLGRVYGMLTNFLGYRAAEEEFKVMGLSALGDPFRFDLNFLSQDESLLFLEESKYFSNYKYTQDEPYYSDLFEKKLKISRRMPGEQFSQEHIDLAASIQHFYEHNLRKFLNFSAKLTNSRNFWFAGGTALNSLANYRMRKEGVASSLTIQPAASDRGLPIGCATYGSLTKLNQAPLLDSLCLGLDYTHTDLKSYLERLGIDFIVAEDMPSLLSELLCSNLIVGIHYSRSEFGPRALGNRSILASPIDKDMKNILNRKIKFRESYRPFACICPEESLHEYFSGSYKAPFMTEIFDALPHTKRLYPSIVHADGTCRVQSISLQSKSFYSEVFRHLSAKGHPPLVINTSFNLSGEPIVETPGDAIRSFYASALDVLLINNFVIKKFAIPGG